MYGSMQAIVDAAKSLPNRQRLVVAAAQDPDVLEAVRDAVDWGIVSAILVGDKEKIAATAAEVRLSLEKCTVIPEADPIAAAHKAVAMVAQGQGDMVMKGRIGTADILRAVLDKEKGLRTGRLLSHVTVFDVQGVGRLLFMTDAAMNIAPDLGQKAQIVQNAVDVVRALGVERPKVAALAAVELVNPDMPAAVEAALLAKMADRGQIKGAIVDGPLALDNAISLHSAQVKGIHSPVAGNADILMVPDIE
ncbi:MAG: bifunctional enoyl-CoA hydratase/phosphate acetyltransferase, partial [Eubacteriales bacterium]|nr:bifunctional enoyl-CoA hydratase/phosphate acetyltransferase [Eubacteriales bacterium]